MVTKKYKNLIFIFLSLFITIFGLFDMTGRILNFKTDPNYVKEYISDKQFVKSIEDGYDINKSKVMIAQYPYLNIPEGPYIHKMGNYEPFFGYIHSKKLYWSFGSMRGRKADLWWNDLINKPIEEQISELENAGFSGLVIDRNGYADNGIKIEHELTEILKENPIVSENKILSFFKLEPKGNIIIVPPIFNGFYAWEGEIGAFRWAGDNANIIFFNYEDKTKEKRISFEIGSLIPRNMIIQYNGKNIDKFAITPGVSSPHTYTLVLDHGENKLEFITSEPSVKPNGEDKRNLTFSISKFN